MATVSGLPTSLRRRLANLHQTVLASVAATDAPTERIDSADDSTSSENDVASAHRTRCS